MNIRPIAFLWLSILVCGCGRPVRPEDSDVPEEVRTLISSYQGLVKGYAKGRILFKKGDPIIFDDGKEKTFTEKLAGADIQDMFSIPYSRTNNPPGYLQDAGRIRCEAFLKRIYGNSEKAVKANLVTVKWFDGQKIPFNRVGGAADSLRAVFIDLQKLPEEFHDYCRGASSFNWREVRGAKQMSAHSFAIAIDINTEYSNYWRWDNPDAGELDRIGHKNRIPEEIIRIFESHGFISGSRWYHYDTMHFEFRPELLLFSGQ